MNERHPERNTDVVLFLDTFTDARLGRRGTLDLTVRAATSLAHRYLQRKDRVGLVSFGGFLSWLLPTSGTRQLYRIVDSLLQMDIVLSFAARGVDVLPPRSLPPKALVLALTPLLDPRTPPALLDLRARGFDLVVVEVSPVPFVDEGSDELEQLSYRLWRLSREAMRARYQQAGIPVVEWLDGVPLNVPLEEVASIQAIRKARARIALAALSVAAYAGVVAYVLARSEEAIAATVALAVVGALFLVWALVRASVAHGSVGRRAARRRLRRRARRARAASRRGGAARGRGVVPLRRARLLVDRRAIRDSAERAVMLARTFALGALAFASLAARGASRRALGGADRIRARVDGARRSERRRHRRRRGRARPPNLGSAAPVDVRRVFGRSARAALSGAAVDRAWRSDAIERMHLTEVARRDRPVGSLALAAEHADRVPEAPLH